VGALRGAILGQEELTTSILSKGNQVRGAVLMCFKN